MARSCAARGTRRTRPLRSTGNTSPPREEVWSDRKSTRLNSSHDQISYAVFCLKKKKKTHMHVSGSIHRLQSANVEYADDSADHSLNDIRRDNTSNDLALYLCMLDLLN